MVSTDSAPAIAGKSRGWRYYLQEKLLVIFFLGFSAGLPLPLVYATLTAWLYEAGLPTSKISLFAYLMLAYSFKFVWSPLVDAVGLPVLTRWLGRRRAWLFASQVGLAVSLYMLSKVDPSSAMTVFVAVAACVAVLSATQDIVLDAYRIEIAPVDMQGVLAASYQYGYRVAIVVSGAGALFLAEFLSWSVAYSVMAACMAVGIVTTLYCKEPQNVTPPDYHFAGTWHEKVAKWFGAAIAGPFADFSVATAGSRY